MNTKEQLLEKLEDLQVKKERFHALASVYGNMNKKVNGWRGASEEQEEYLNVLEKMSFLKMLIFYLYE